MKIIDAKQGSDEWLNARLGIPTSSVFDKILTATGKLSKQADKYLAELIAEWRLGQPADDESSKFMDRGNELEPEASKWYALTYDAEPHEVGLCLTDDLWIGASPDRLVGDDGLLEIKCPSAKVHCEYALDPAKLEKAYRVQVQGQLYVTGRKWCDILSYNPTISPVVVRVKPDPKFQAALGDALREFVEKIQAARERIGGEEPTSVTDDQDHPF